MKIPGNNKTVEDNLRFIFDIDKFVPKANQIQINDYNNLRKAKSSYAINPRNSSRENTSELNLNSYKLLGNVMDSQSNRTFQPNVLFNSLDKIPAEVYKAADGTVFKRYETNGEQIDVIDYPSKNVIHTPGKYHELYRTSLKPDEVPSNIKHKYGARETNNLLENQVKVHDTISAIQNYGVHKKTNKDNLIANELEKEMGLVLNKKKENSYYDLGNYLRHAVCHGYPSMIKTTLKEDVHSGDVNKQHLSDLKNIESPYRRKKDWLGNLKRLIFFFTRVLIDI